MLKLKLIRLSESSDVTDSEETTGIAGLDGQINVMEDDRQFFMAEFGDSDNPFAPTVARMIAQGQVGNWKGLDPKTIASYVGKKVPGKIESIQVKPYTIGEGEDERTVKSKTYVVFAHETIELLVQADKLELPIGEIDEEAPEKVETP